MKLRGFATLVSLTAIGALGLAAASPAAATPLWNLDLHHLETNFHPGQTAEYWVDVNNVGDTDTSGPVTLTVKLPNGLTRESVRESQDYVRNTLAWKCPGAAGSATIVCTSTGTVNRHSLNRTLIISVNVNLPPGSETDLFASAKIEGGGAPVAPPSAGCAVGAGACALEPTHVAPQDAGFGILASSFLPDFFEADGVTTEREAGAHPDLLSTPFDFNTISFPTSDHEHQKIADESIRDLEVDLPPGFIGNPNAVSECTQADFTFGKCQPSSQVGRTEIRIYPVFITAPNYSYSTITTGVFNLAHPRGVISDLAFAVAGNPVHIKASLDPANHYAVTTQVANVNEFRPAYSQSLTLWGVPNDSSHDSERCPRFTNDTVSEGFGGNTEEECSTDAQRKPFLSLPSQCESENVFRLHHYDSWQNRGVYGPEIDYTMPGKLTDCDKPRFEPDVEIVPTGHQANSPTGLDVHIKVAQNDNPNALATPPVKRTTVRLPEGMTFSPSFADGLQACSLAQMKLGTNEAVQCPDASRIGEVSLHTPLLPKSAEGSMYLAAQGNNPFGSLFGLYLVLHDTEERGALIKIPGKIEVDPLTGQITTVFPDTPQFPFDDLTLKFRSGPRAPLINPPSCGSHAIGVEMASYAEPQKAVDVSNTYEVTEGPNGTPCPPDSARRPFSPSFSGGTLNPVAGAYSPFLFRLSREDQEQELSQVSTVLPPGLVAKIAGVSFCPEAVIASIPTTEGTAANELAHPACPLSSQIGSVSAGVGAGPGPNYFNGKVYLAGPYKGAPLSLAIVLPGIAGPIDLGNVVVRTALYVNPDSTQVRAVSDPFPTILHGVLLRVRDVRLRMDRPETTINPTNCSQMSVNGQITGVGGSIFTTADDSLFNAATPFQVGSCGDLAFKPKLAFRLFGGTHRGSHPKLKATLTMPKGGANIAAASVALPHSEFLDQGHIGTVCTRVQFNSGAGNGAGCPAAAIYGTATAKSPLLDETLTGNAYLRSSSHELPDLVVALQGKIDVNVVGRVDSVNGGIRNTFEAVPDAPVESFTLTLAGGKKGLLVNSRDICKAPAKATAKFTGQNGAKVTLHPELKSACGKAKKHKPSERAR
jgi:uncharacterized repeat protein (TIGR01451 family)